MKKYKAFERILNPGTVEEHTHGGILAHVPMFVKVKYSDDGRLSITGVVGPKSNGDAWGSCGQCTDSLDRVRPGLGWGGKVGELRAIWDRWHLNDMRAGCEHQRADGWAEKGLRKVTRFHWRLIASMSEKQKVLQEAALGALRAGRTFKPTKEQAKIAAMPYALETWGAEAVPYYEPARPLYAGSTGSAEEKALGWLRPDEHPDGILCRPCPTCGYEYGSAWLREEVPGEVLAVLQSFPETTVTPAWV